MCIRDWCKLGAAVLMLLTGFGGSRRLLRVTLVFFGLSCAFGGGIFAIGLLGGRGLTLRNGVLYSVMDLRILLLSAAVCYAVLTLVFRRTARHGRREVLPAVLTLEGRRVAVNALVDTGNTLTAVSYTHLPSRRPSSTGTASKERRISHRTPSPSPI